MEEKYRLDKWLWAARFFKTRTLATDAVNGGHVHLNGSRSKPGRNLRIGESITIRKGPYEYQVIVRDLSNRRGPAKVAVTLYEESPESVAKRERVAQGMKSMLRPITGGRPTKRQRRDYARIRGKD